MSQHQFDALVSFTFNIGEPNLRISAVLRHLNARRYSVVPRFFSSFETSGSVRLPGLIRRRREESRMFEFGIYP